jgi:glycosyltransferase involved in cell wall biosynthesis
MSRPRVLFVGRTRYRLPLEGPLAAKWDALSARLDLRVLASGTGYDPRFRLFRPRPLEGPLFYATLPARVARELRSFLPDAVVAESAFEAVACELARRATGSRAKLVVEVPGDWRTSTRLYGSPARAGLAPAADRLAAWALRRADAIRAVSGFTATLVRGVGREPDAVFTAYTDLGAFDGPVTPVPEEPRALFVGVLERYKNVEGLAAAWREVARRLPEAQLHLVGDGPQAEVAAALAREGARWDRRLPQPEVAAALDAVRVLVLASESEGLPRVVVEAFLRGRPVVATRAGGTPEIVEHDSNGLLVERGDPGALAAALERVLTDRELAQRLGDAARASATSFVTTPEEFAGRFRTLVDGVLSR